MNFYVYGDAAIDRSMEHGCGRECVQTGEWTACKDCADTTSASRASRLMTTWIAFGGKGWECPKCGGLVAITKKAGPVPCPFGCLTTPTTEGDE